MYSRSLFFGGRKKKGPATAYGFRLEFSISYCLFHYIIGCVHLLPGADVTANDGIYSAYFTQFKGNGRYSVVAEVVGDGSAIIVRGRRGSGGLPVVASPPGTWPAITDSRR